jgi:hypothetical protein
MHPPFTKGLPHKYFACLVEYCQQQVENQLQRLLFWQHFRSLKHFAIALCRCEYNYIDRIDGGLAFEY